MSGLFSLIFMGSVAFRAARFSSVFKFYGTENCCVDEKYRERQREELGGLFSNQSRVINDSPYLAAVKFRKERDRNKISVIGIDYEKQKRENETALKFSSLVPLPEI